MKSVTLRFELRYFSHFSLQFAPNLEPGMSRYGIKSLEMAQGYESLPSYHDFSQMYFSDQLVIALDFGTTYSGIAYAFANAGSPDIISIYQWPVIFLLMFVGSVAHILQA